ncbi:hypothetical protein UG55_11314 [Frankia sp. EI5c]|uniref:hypothetical protein n=1 Tax=Frankia sp. EI5c TaxID=683316 RepID=UPI0007C353A2|nr:hypothetical protein [Frankia sp. EI5c]OAA18081.1 hypothetical protein UG55_11314 [Frankia sp. EI5c]
MTTPDQTRPRVPPPSRPFPPQPPPSSLRDDPPPDGPEAPDPGIAGPDAEGDAPLVSTAADLLFDAGDAAAALGRLLTGRLPDLWSHLAGAGVGPETVADVGRDLATEILSSARINVVEAILSAWSAWQPVREAAARTTRAALDAPAGDAPAGDRVDAAADQAVGTASETILVGPHALGYTHDQQIQIFVGEENVADLPLQLTLRFELERASLTLQGSRLVRLHPGPGVLLLTLALDGLALKTARRDLQLPSSIPLGRGLPVRPAQDLGDETGAATASDEEGGSENADGTPGTEGTDATPGVDRAGPDRPDAS